MHHSKNGQVCGRVVGLWRYPVKSMGAEELKQAEVSWHGVVGDRRWAFIRGDVVNSGFPWFTLRQRGDMNQYQPSFVDPTQPDQSPVVVKTPTGEQLEITSAALKQELGGDSVCLMKQNRGIFDTFPLSLITTQTIAKLSERVDVPLEIQRFRPNILVDSAEAAAFPEDQWVGRVLRIGGVRMRVDKRDGRCVVITIDPVTSERNPAILRTVASERQGCLGVYGSTVEPGCIEWGDSVLIEN